MLGYTYTSAAVVPDGTAAPVVENEQVDYVPTARPGHRAPHLQVTLGTEEVSTTDLVGGGFTLLTGPGGQRWREAAAHLPVRAYVVGGDHGDLGDPQQGWADLYTNADHGAVLVRPDGHVAWRNAGMADDPRGVLEQVLNALLAR